jgi:hypothetical protein
MHSRRSSRHPPPIGHWDTVRPLGYWVVKAWIGKRPIVREDLERTSAWRALNYISI